MDNTLIILILLLFPLFCVIMAYRESDKDNYGGTIVWIVLLVLWFAGLPLIFGEPRTNCINYIDDFGIHHCIDKEILNNK